MLEVVIAPDGKLFGPSFQGGTEPVLWEGQTREPFSKSKMGLMPRLRSNSDATERLSAETYLMSRQLKFEVVEVMPVPAHDAVVPKKGAIGR